MRMAHPSTPCRRPGLGRPQTVPPREHPQASDRRHRREERDVERFGRHALAKDVDAVRRGEAVRTADPPAEAAVGGLVCGAALGMKEAVVDGTAPEDIPPDARVVLCVDADGDAAGLDSHERQDLGARLVALQVAGKAGRVSG